MSAQSFTGKMHDTTLAIRRGSPVSDLDLEKCQQMQSTEDTSCDLCLRQIERLWICEMDEILQQHEPDFFNALWSDSTLDPSTIQFIWDAAKANPSHKAVKYAEKLHENGRKNFRNMSEKESYVFTILFFTFH